MPELPDVEAFRRVFAGNGLGRRVSGLDLRAEEMLRGAGRDDLARALTGRTFEDGRRHGKILFLRAGDGPWVVLHFGMTGALVCCTAEEELPPHARLVICLEGDGLLAFDNQRKFGWIELTDDIGAYLEANEVGPDVLELDRDGFAGIVGATRGAVKPALMDQSKLAGIGNVYSDEILFRARIGPEVQGNALSDDQLSTLYRTTREVLREAADILAEGRAFPDDWLVRHREAGDTCPRCGTALEKREVSGRSAWLCPACQGGGQAA